MPVHIRLARTSEADEIARIYRPFVESTIISFETVPPEPSEIADRIAATMVRYPWLVCERNQRIMVISLPSLDGIKRAVELNLGVALLPRRCAITEIASGRLVAVPVSGISRRRQLTLVCRKAHRSHAANAFLAVAQEKTREANKLPRRLEEHEDPQS